MRARSLSFALFLSLCGVVAACDGLDEILDPGKEEDETPGDDDDDDGGNPTPTNTPANTPVITTDGDVTTIDWGTEAIPAADEGSPIFRFDAPANTIGLDLMVLGDDTEDDVIFGFFGVEAPGNRVVIDNSGDGPTRQAFELSAKSIAFPADDSSTSAAEDGQWEFAIFASDGNDFVATNPQVLVKVRTAPGGTVPAGELHLNVFFVGGAGATAADCSNGSSSVMQGLGYANGLYQGGTSQIEIASVSCYDLPSSTSFAEINSRAELGDLFELSASAPDAFLNLFFVQGFDPTELGNAAGIAGSVPIPMDVNGTRSSGVAVQMSSNAAVLGETIAHELGHALGLYHSTEFDASQNGFDDISDTPQCPDLGLSDPGDCPDDTNVMFPSLTGEMISFSPGQLTVLEPTVYVQAAASSFAPVGHPVPVIAPGSRAWSGPPLTCRGGTVSR